MHGVHGDSAKGLTIGQLAQYAGVTIKAVRHYHRRGLLPEPWRDASGYRRYTAEDAIALVKIKTLAEASVPLARGRESPGRRARGVRPAHTRSIGSYRSAPSYAALASGSRISPRAIGCSSPKKSPISWIGCGSSESASERSR